MVENDSAIFAGLATRVINPPLGLSLAGFPGERCNTGVSELELCVRSLVFSDSADAAQIAVVAIDNLGLGADVVQQIRQRACEKMPALSGEAIMIAATHTHSAPALRQYNTAKAGKSAQVNEDYRNLVVETVAECIAAAWDVRQSVRIGYGCTQLRLHHNRRVVGPDGKATNEWLDPNGTHTGVVNDNLSFVSFASADSGKPLWLLGSYACHPVTMGPPNVKASADYPGAFVRAISEKLSLQDAVFITGAGADANPLKALGDDPQLAVNMGTALADKICEDISCLQGIEALPIRCASVPLKLKLGPEARENYSNRAADAGDSETITSEVQALRIGKLLIVSAPGELFAEIGMAIESLYPQYITIVASFTNDYLGYLFTDKALAEGGYEPKNAISLDIEKPLLAAAKAAIEQVL